MNPFCTCAVCVGVAPWTERFPECMQVRFSKTVQAVESGEAMAVEGHVWWWPFDQAPILVEELESL